MFLQDRGLPWDMEMDDFRGGYHANAPQLRILRLRADYTDSAGKTSPVMRIVGFLPHVTTATVYEHLTDVKLRCKWDANYTHFAQFEGACPFYLEDAELRRPLAEVAKKRPHCTGDVCKLVPDIASDVVERGWFSHRVGGALLRRFGLVDRLFQYERACYIHQLLDSTGAAPVTDNRPALYDILYSGSRKVHAEVSAASPQLGEWLHASSQAVPCEKVAVNFQHIALLPIADANAQLFHNEPQLLQLCTMESMLSKNSSKLMYNVLKETCERTASAATPLPGTLFVMTSANDVSVPRFLPRWVRAAVSGAVSRNAYGNLLGACCRRDLQ